MSWTFQGVLLVVCLSSFSEKLLRLVYSEKELLEEELEKTYDY
ncbi:MAG: hypothetical protein ACFFD4_36810 [Candidatus Odinarchaeota archaeon]